MEESYNFCYLKKSNIAIKNVQNFNFIGHLTRFSSKNNTEYEVIERTVIAENDQTGDLKEDTAVSHTNARNVY